MTGSGERTEALSPSLSGGARPREETWSSLTTYRVYESYVIVCVWVLLNLSDIPLFWPAPGHLCLDLFSFLLPFFLPVIYLEGPRLVIPHHRHGGGCCDTNRFPPTLGEFPVVAMSGSFTKKKQKLA